MIAIADTGFVVAIENQRDRYHRLCLTIYQQAERIYMPQTVLNEVCYLLTRERGNRAVVSFLRKLPISKFISLALISDDIQRTAEILDQYADSRVDFVDATIVAVSERLEIVNILTLDQRDFHIVRPKHTPSFTLLPA